MQPIDDGGSIIFPSGITPPDNERGILTLDTEEDSGFTLQIFFAIFYDEQFCCYLFFGEIQCNKRDTFLAGQ